MAAFAIAIASSLPDGTSAAQSDAAMWNFYHDASAVRQRFSVTGASGWVEYREAYARASLQPLFVYLDLTAKTRLICMNSLDFEFDLRRYGEQQPIPNHPQQWHFGGQPLPPGGVVIVRLPCPYGPRHNAMFPFKLDELYPDLKPGKYTLALTFAPRDKSSLVIHLTEVTFRVQ